MIKRGLILFAVILLLSTLVSALAAQDYYVFLNVADFTGAITKGIIFIILALLIYRGCSNTIFQNNPWPSAILSILISFLTVKYFPASLTEILTGIAVLAVIGIIAWLIARALAGENAQPGRRFAVSIFVFIVLLIFFFFFLRIGEHLGYKGMFDYPIAYELGNYLDYFFQAEFFFNLQQFVEGFRIFGYGSFGLLFLFILGNIFAIAFLVNRFRTNRYTQFFFWLIVYVISLILILGYPTYFY